MRRLILSATLCLIAAAAQAREIQQGHDCYTVDRSGYGFLSIGCSDGHSIRLPGRYLRKTIRGRVYLVNTATGHRLRAR